MATVDPDVRAVLDELAAGAYDTGRIDRSETDEQRRSAIETDPLLRRETAPGLRTRDLLVPGPHGDVPVRAYLPAGTGEPPGVAMYFHGGGFHSGTIDLYDATCRELAAGSGCAIVSVGYRLAPEHPYPVPLDDCSAATAWVQDNAAELGVDGARLAVVGGSAGGNLAAAVALRARDGSGPRITHQVLLFPAAGHRPDSPSMHEFAQGYWLTADTVEYCWHTYLPRPEDRTDPYASPIDAPDLSGLPSALVITAECDPLRDVGELYAQRLADAGVPTRLSRYFGTIHGFTLMAGRIRRGREALAEVAASLAGALGSPHGHDGLVASALAAEVVRRYFEDELHHADLDGADALHGEDYVWHAPNGRSLDRDETSRFVRSLYRAHSDVTVDVHDLVAQGDRCVARFTMAGRQTGTWMGVGAADQKMSMRGQILCRVRDGRIAEAWELIVEERG